MRHWQQWLFGSGRWSLAYSASRYRPCRRFGHQEIAFRSERNSHRRQRRWRAEKRAL